MRISGFDIRDTEMAVFQLPFGKTLKLPCAGYGVTPEMTEKAGRIKELLGEYEIPYRLEFERY